MREFIVGGLLISPFVRVALIALVVFLPVRLILVHLHLQTWFWHPLLAEMAVYVCILATLTLFL